LNALNSLHFQVFVFFFNCAAAAAAAVAVAGTVFSKNNAVFWGKEGVTPTP
jgi:hypothetical protein